MPFHAGVKDQFYLCEAKHKSPLSRLDIIQPLRKANAHVISFQKNMSQHTRQNFFESFIDCWQDLYVTIKTKNAETPISKRS